MSREIYRQKRSTDSCSAIIRDGVTAAWPICLGYAPIGLAFGVLAQQTGLTPAEIGLMSLPVFAGSAQFMPVSMLSGGAAAIPIILTTFTINLRHLLMSSSLAVHLRHPKDEPIYQEVSRGGTSPTR